MRKIAIICLLFIIAGLLGIVVLVLRSQKPVSIFNTAQQLQVEQFHHAYFMQPDFYTGILNPDTVEPINAQVYGGIVSHHFFVERYIARLFNSWSQQKFKTVVVLGPNHFNAGNSDVQISKEAYQTPWGNLEPNQNIINQLIDSGIARNEEGPFGREHSISVEVGFIKHQFPDAQVVPVILKHNTTKEKMRSLAEQLNKILPNDALVLASVDFSHHVTNEIAKQQDKLSINLLKKWNADEIWKFPSTQMDSPATIYALMKYLEFRQAKNMNYLNTNQALVSGSLDSTDVTSYVFASFLK